MSLTTTIMKTKLQRGWTLLSVRFSDCYGCKHNEHQISNKTRIRQQAKTVLLKKASPVGCLGSVYNYKKDWFQPVLHLSMGSTETRFYTTTSTSFTYSKHQIDCQEIHVKRECRTWCEESITVFASLLAVLQVWGTDISDAKTKQLTDEDALHSFLRGTSGTSPGPSKAYICTDDVVEVPEYNRNRFNL